MMDQNALAERLGHYMPHPVAPVAVIGGGEPWELTIDGLGRRAWTPEQVEAFLDGLDTALRIASRP